MKKTLQRILAVCFCLPIAFSLTMPLLFPADGSDYDTLQPEYTGIQTISRVFFEDGRLYVCYSGFGCVNAYDADGGFLWAVNAPIDRWADYTLADGRLIIWDWDAYVFHSSDGTFLEKSDAQTLGLLSEEDEEEPPRLSGGYRYNAYEVFRQLPDGRELTIVDRPGWFYLTNFGLCWLISFSCGIGWFAVEYADKLRDFLRLERGLRPGTRKGRICVAYLKGKCAVQLLFAAADVLLALRGVDISIWSMAVVGHFIVSNGIIWNVLPTLEEGEEQRRLISFWKASDVVTLFAGILSILVANALLGNL